MITRRQLLRRGAIGTAMIAAPGGVLLGGTQLVRDADGLVTRPAGAAPLPKLRRWAAPCPTPSLGASSWPIIDARSGTAAVTARQFKVRVHPDLPPTTVWGYLAPGEEPDATTGIVPGRSTYLGPTVVARRGTPVALSVDNGLPATPLFPTDPALRPVDPETHDPAADCRISTHLHGGRVWDSEDGNPFDAYADLAAGQREVGPSGSQTQTYANQQGAGLLWYHDHALGITRTNVYAGLAGGYLLTEPDPALDAANVPTAFDQSEVPDPLAPGTFIPLHIPLVIQDKVLGADGQLVYPSRWAPEFFGDTCLVNGTAFPYLEVQRRKYRFTFLNGSQSRFYHLAFNKRVPITQIGVELGLLDAPQPITSILLAPAERADVIIDFSTLDAGTKVVMSDRILPPGVVSPTRPLGDCLQLRVVGTPVTGLTFPGDPVLPGWSATSTTPRPLAAAVTPPASKVTLEEVMGRGGKPVMAVVNGSPFMRRDAAGAMTHEVDEPFSTEIVQGGSTVEWDYINLTADSHPFHTHLGHFEVIHRQAFDAGLYAQDLHELRDSSSGRVDPSAYPDPADARYTPGPVVPAPPREIGPKDTVIANPNEITRIRVVFDLPDGANPSARTVEASTVEGSDLVALPSGSVSGADVGARLTWVAGGTTPVTASVVAVESPTEVRISADATVTESVDVTITPPAHYVFHCHILEHEENEMMRPLRVDPPAPSVS